MVCMIVREFTKEDKEAFFTLCRDFYMSGSTLYEYEHSVAEKTFLRVMDHHENLWGYMFVDKDTNLPIGYALVTSFWSNEEGGDLIYLDEIYLNPIDRSKGYASAFMEWLETHFPDAAALTLEVHADNAKAIRFYERAGFKPDGYISYTKRITKKEG